LTKLPHKPPAFTTCATSPQPPEQYIAHPYTLLQTKGLIGRLKELDLLTDWVAAPEKFGHARIFCVVAIGGMGKSALTWKWFNDIAPQEMRSLAGRMWWSFYESDATFENLVIRALAYVSGQTIEKVKQDLPPERERKLLAVLDRQPFLLVLDGLERLLIAYARMDAARLQDTDLDDKAVNQVVGALGPPPSAGQSFGGRHQLRKTADVRVGQFLRKLAGVRASRVLISTRLYPADLQAPMGEPLAGCFAFFLPGLSDRDAVELWSAFGAKGSLEVMLPVFRSFDSHPLLIQILASEVANFHTAPGNFDTWRTANPDFNPFDLPMVQVQSHVLAVALRGLSPAERRTLHVMAGFRMPPSMDTLKALLILRTGEGASMEKKPFDKLAELDACLTALEDRGLLGWDRRANRYDLHPIVRGVTWRGLDEGGRRNVCGTLRGYFDAMPKVEDNDVNSLEDLTPAIELYNTLIGLERYDEAYSLFRDRLGNAMLIRLSVCREAVGLLEMLFPAGVEKLPALRDPACQADTLQMLGLGHDGQGRPGLAAQFLLRSKRIYCSLEKQAELAYLLSWLSNMLRFTGTLRHSESCALEALVLLRQFEMFFDTVARKSGFPCRLSLFSLCFLRPFPG
jgi:hypothetical protein